MTINATNFAGRIFAAAFAVLLSTTMVLSSVGPAFNSTNAVAQSDIA